MARAYAALEATTKRLRIGDYLTNMFRAIMLASTDDVLAATYLTMNRWANGWENRRENRILE